MVYFIQSGCPISRSSIMTPDWVSNSTGDMEETKKYETVSQAAEKVLVGFLTKILKLYIWRFLGWIKLSWCHSSPGEHLPNWSLKYNKSTSALHTEVQKQEGGLSLLKKKSRFPWVHVLSPGWSHLFRGVCRLTASQCVYTGACVCCSLTQNRAVT